MNKLRENLKEDLKPMGAPVESPQPRGKLQRSATQAVRSVGPTRPLVVAPVDVPSAPKGHRPECGSEVEVPATPVQDPNRKPGFKANGGAAKNQPTLENGTPAVREAALSRGRAPPMAEAKGCGPSLSHLGLGPDWVQPSQQLEANATLQQPYAANFVAGDARPEHHVDAADPGGHMNGNGACLVRHGCGRVLGADGSTRRVGRSMSWSASRGRTPPARAQQSHACASQPQVPARRGLY